jgi:hypothetical protein
MEQTVTPPMQEALRTLQSISAHEQRLRRRNFGLVDTYVGFAAAVSSLALAYAIASDLWADSSGLGRVVMWVIAMAVIWVASFIAAVRSTKAFPSTKESLTPKLKRRLLLLLPLALVPALMVRVAAGAASLIGAGPSVLLLAGVMETTILVILLAVGTDKEERTVRLASIAVFALLAGAFAISGFPGTLEVGAAFAGPIAGSVYVARGALRMWRV